MYDKEKILELIKGYDRFYEIITEDIGPRFAKLHKERFEGVDDIEASETSIEVYMSYGCRSGCCTEYGHLSIPTEYLWTENWEEIEKERMAERAKVAEEKKRQEEEEKKKTAEAAKRAQYEKLKAEFEPLDEAKYVLEKMKEKTGATIISHKEEGE